MRLAYRAAIAAALLLVLGFILAQYHHERLSRAWSDVVAYSRTRMGANETIIATNCSSDIPPRKEKAIVMARLEREDTTWVAENLQDWDHAIYTVDAPTQEISVPLNKGNEAMAYLTYILDHYSSLPETILFLHSHRSSWHNDPSLYDTVDRVRNLQIPFVQEQGYVNLRCKWNPGCPGEVQVNREPADKRSEVEVAYPDAWAFMFNATQAPPDAIGVGCCSEFAVSANAVRGRSWEDYHRYREWLLQTDLENAVSGRIFEYSWHIIFGKDPVTCPITTQCYCDVYGMC